MYSKIIEQDFDLFISELKRPWGTMDQDMQLAYEIILQTHDEDEDDVCLLNIKHTDNDEYQLEFRQYGEAQGRLIFQKVVMRLFQQSRNSADALH
jgi:hypothetical protein